MDNSKLLQIFSSKHRLEPAVVMNTIIQLVILTLTVLLVNADDQYCTYRYKELAYNCSTPMITIKNCCEIRKFPLLPGIFKLSKGAFGNTVDVYCDTITDGGGWMVITKNKKSSTVSFKRNWTDYEEGFGDLNTEFWYGLKEIQCLTQTGKWEMRVDYQKEDTSWSYLHYKNFSLGSTREEYKLNIDGFTGAGTDHFASQPLNGMRFSTKDNDNDGHVSSNCAVSWGGAGWWYNKCADIGLTYVSPWVGGKGMLSAEMKIRTTGCVGY